MSNYPTVYDDGDDDLQVGLPATTSGGGRLPITSTPAGIAAMATHAMPPGAPPLSEADKPLAHSFLAAVAGAPPSFINKALRWYSELDENIRAVEHERDEGDEREGEDQLRRDLGQAGAAEAKRDGARYLATLPVPIESALLGARLPDGRLLFNSAMGVRWFAQVAKAMSGQGSPASRAGWGDEIAEIEHIMRTDRRRYTRDEAMQARYRDLIARRDGL